MRLWGWMPEHSFLGRSVVHLRPDGWLVTACLSVGRSNLSSRFRTKIYSHFSALLWMFWHSYRSCYIKVLHFPQLRSDDGRSSSCHWSLRLFGSPFRSWTWWRGYQTGRWLWWHMHIYADGSHHRRSSDLKTWIGVSSVRPREGVIFHTICVVPPLGNRSYTTTDNLAMICVSIYPNWMCATPSALF